LPRSHPKEKFIKEKHGFSRKRLGCTPAFCLQKGFGKAFYTKKEGKIEIEG